MTRRRVLLAVVALAVVVFGGTNWARANSGCRLFDGAAPGQHAHARLQNVVPYTWLPDDWAVCAR